MYEHKYNATYQYLIINIALEFFDFKEGITYGGKGIYIVS